MKALGYIAATIIVVTYSTLLQGWFISKLWTWFIVTTFHLVPLSIPAAIGVSLVLSAIHGSGSKTEKDKTYGQVLGEGFFYVTLKVFIGLGVGAIVKMYL